MMFLPIAPDPALIAALSQHPAIIARLRSQIMDLLLAARPDTAETIIRNAVVGFGGTLVEPSRPATDDSRISSWGPFDYQLDLLGCSGTGTTMDELAADWAKAAWLMMPAGAEVAA